jgi:SAM-dependent methyltransferase
MSYTDINSEIIDRWIEKGWEWGIPVSHESFLAAKKGDWEVVLTPVKPVPKDWFPKMRGIKLLGLACGGGQQMPIFTALGAQCTVFDYSKRQLDSERLVAEREGYQINIVRGDMSKPLPFEDNSFDMIFHPVSNCYIEDVQPVWNECFRILKSGGILMAGLDNGINFIFDDEEKKLCHSLPFNPLKDERLYKELIDNEDGVQFSHTLEEQLRGQLKAGFIFKDLYEDTNGSGRLHDMGIPAFWATLAVKP